MLDRDSLEPLYLQIRNILRAEILEGQYQEGDAFYGEIDLVDRFGVARGTIRQALNVLEQEGFVRRKRGQGTFICASHLAVTEPTLNTCTVAFIVQDLNNAFVPTIMRGIEATLREQQAHLLFRNVDIDLSRQSQALRDVRAYGVDGIILYPVDGVYQDGVLLQLLAEKFPVVLVDRYIQGLAADYVITDGYGGMLRAVQHLLGLGHRRIGYVIWDAHEGAQVGRLLGYQQALREWGIEPRPDLICQDEYGSRDISRLAKFLTQPDRPTAIVTLNEPLAIRVMQACRQVGLRIPDQLALIGFDDTDMAVQLEVPLTAVAQPAYDMGFQAARLLLQKIAGTSQEIQRIILPTHLVIRKSCGATISPERR